VKSYLDEKGLRLARRVDQSRFVFPIGSFDQSGLAAFSRFI